MPRPKAGVTEALFGRTGDIVRNRPGQASAQLLDPVGGTGGNARNHADRHALDGFAFGTVAVGALVLGGEGFGEETATATMTLASTMGRSRLASAGVPTSMKRVWSGVGWVEPFSSWLTMSVATWRSAGEPLTTTLWLPAS